MNIPPALWTPKYVFRKTNKRMQQITPGSSGKGRGSQPAPWPRRLGGDMWRCYWRGGGDGKNSICAKGLGSIAGQWEFPLSSEPISQCQKQGRKKPQRKYKQIIFQQTAKRTKISWRGRYRRLGLCERKALIQSALHSYISWVLRR